MEDKEAFSNEETGKITQRYDKKVLDLFKQIESLDNEVKRLKVIKYTN